ncbi:MAG: MATE family efflux transporter [Spirochaetaceae bacterium]|jgi:putative MATE family efflux protein|nr:MATE family efflux transporter [Spirochaetaceae bacterium]
MGSRPVKHLLFTMSVPMMASMMVQALYNIVDSVFVARLGENALAAVTLAFPVQAVMIGAGAGVGVGANALLSKSLGERRYKQANQTALHAVFLVLPGAAFFALAGGLFGTRYFAVQTDSTEIIALGKDYLIPLCLCSFALLSQITFERLLSSTGKTLYAMISQMTGAALNMALDPIMIFGLFGFPALGVKGAAIATVAGQCAACVAGLACNLRKNREIRLSPREFGLDLSIIKTIYRVGVSSILMQTTGSLMIYGINRILLSFGPAAIAVFGVFFRLQSFLLMPVFGLNNAMVPIIAFNYGAGNRGRIAETVRLGMLWAGAVMFAGFLLFQVLPDRMLLLFSAGAEMRAIGVPALRIISIGFLFVGFCIVGITVFQALDNGAAGAVVAVSRQLALLLLLYLLSLRRIIDALWWAFPLAEALCLGICAALLKRVYTRKIRAVPDEVS